jgi:hypothetical protein
LGALGIFVVLVQLRFMISVSSRGDDTDIDEILLALPHAARRDIQRPRTSSSSYDHRPREAAPEEVEPTTPPINDDDTRVAMNKSPMLPPSPRIIPRIVVVNIQHNNNHHHGAWTARFFGNGSSERIGRGSGNGDGSTTEEGLLRERMSNTHGRLISVHRADVFHKRSSVRGKLSDAPTLVCPSEYCARIAPNWYDPNGLDYVDGYDTEH